MDALLSTFLAAAMAEWGDKTQLLVMALAARYGRPGPVLAGIFLAAIANALAAAFGGTLLNGMITLRAISLLVAVSLVFAGVAGLVGNKTPDMGATWRTGPFLTAAGCFFLLEFGDKTQFLTAALAAQFDSLLLAAAGAAAGVAAASLPAVLLGDRLAVVMPLRAIRLTAAILFLILGLVVAVNALRLV
ncbi:TMEM165/GDT1 family protein [Sphingosinicella rhizophila]|uniref:GDT1 family protein n=1 Tax=Sphingosinicella rhizophila TaxID=3050082 RepID=A0ABU3Q7G5_9SPHN|nr:TMEM165/GDT1 family protein [Sphingosinicella sp. GR2756]MDT9599326.1 TMEM165/GDT1 family protein [Sphingosinicella sp. GR2756]